MNLKSNIINNAISGFITMFKSGSRSFIVKRLSAFVLSLIIFVSSVFCQYCTAVVSAAEVGAIFAVDLIVELAITGGIVAGLFRSAEIVQGEVSTGYGFGSDGLDDFASSLNQSLNDDVSSGVITSSEAGTVNKLSGVPIEIICPAYGIYQFLCTNQLANKIRVEQPDTLEEYQNIVNAYWSSVDILDQSTFEEIASDPHNWVTNLDELNNSASATFSTAAFDAYGLTLNEPASSFFSNYIFAKIFWNDSFGGSFSAQANSTFVNSDYQYLVIREYTNSSTFNLKLWYLNPSDDAFVYHGASSSWTLSRPVLSFDTFGIESITLSPDKALEIGYNTTDDLDIRDIIDGAGQVSGIEATDAIDLIDWCWGDARFWNTDILDLAIQEIADTVDAQVDTGEGTGAIDVPIDLPIDIPIEGEGDIAWPGTDSEEDFDDPSAYPGTDDWADVDETDWPTFDPDPEDPDPEDPDPEDPDNPPVDPDEELPPLAVPQLFTLFPFCIPFDIHKALMFFETDMAEGGSPEFRIPFRIILPNNQAIIYDDIVINFDGYDIPLILYYIKAALVVTHCIVLGYATTKFIY